jgi:hypothetical protein
LNETFLLLPIITPSYLTSDWCREEFQRFLQRERALGRNDRIIPIYYLDVPRLSAAMQHPARVQPSDDAIINELAPRLAADWRTLRGKADDVVWPEIERIAKRIIQVIEEIEQPSPKAVEIGQAEQAQPKAVEIVLLTFPLDRRWTGQPILIDWSDAFNSVMPLPQAWQEQLLPELKSIYSRMREQEIKLIQLTINARISAALAFGYVFRRTSGIQIVATDQHGRHWRTGDCIPDTPILNESSEQVDTTGIDITVEISIAQHVSDAVARWIQDTQPSVRQRLKFTLPDNTQITEEQAREIACQIRTAIAEKRENWTPRTTHLFGAMPAGLAVLIGWHLNTFEPIQCYEFVGGTYQPSCLLS